MIIFSFKKNRFGRSERFDRTNTTNMSRFGFSRASLSSIQRRVIARLKDRPPRYVRDTNAPTTTPSAIPRYIPGEPPPLYDGVTDIEPHRDLPPEYSIAIVSSPNLNTRIIRDDDNVLNNNNTHDPQTLSSIDENTDSSNNILSNNDNMCNINNTTDNNSNNNKSDDDDNNNNKNMIRINSVQNAEDKDDKNIKDENIPESCVDNTSETICNAHVGR